MKKRFLKVATLIGILAGIGASNVSFGDDGKDGPRRVSVSGVCNRMVTPDRGSIVVVSEVRDPDLKVAAKKATEMYERARQAIQKLDLENMELKTVEYSLGQVREWEKDKSVSKGFRARMGLKVATSTTQRLGEVIALAAREGLQEVGQMSMYLSDEKALKEQMACLQDAAQNAKAKAEKLAGALGAKVGSTLSITEATEGPHEPPPMRMNSVRARGSDMEPPSVEAGQQNLSLTIQAVFELK